MNLKRVWFGCIELEATCDWVTMQKLSLQLACRFFADSNIFHAGSWCFGALFISLYLLTLGGKDRCALQYLLHLHTHKRLLLGGCFGVFLIGFEVMVWFPFGCSVSDAISFSTLSCSLAWSSFGSECQSRFGSGRAPGRAGVPGLWAWHSWHRSCTSSAGIATVRSKAVTWICQICIETMWTCLKY